MDYPDIAKVVCDRVVSGESEKGILVCGTGIGMSIAANKVKGIRAALLSDTFSAKMTAAHNNSNVIALGGRVLGAELAKDIQSEIIGTLSRSDMVQEAEDLGKTVVEAFPDSEMAGEYRLLAKEILKICGVSEC